MKVKIQLTSDQVSQAVLHNDVHWISLELAAPNKSERRTKFDSCIRAIV